LTNWCPSKTELPNKRILPLTISFIASLAGLKIFLGSNSIGDFTRNLRIVAVKASRRSVSIFIFVTPREMAFLMCSSGIPFAPLGSAPYLTAFSIIHDGTLRHHAKKAERQPFHV